MTALYFMGFNHKIMAENKYGTKKDKDTDTASTQNFSGKAFDLETHVSRSQHTEAAQNDHFPAEQPAV